MYIIILFVIRKCSSLRWIYFILDNNISIYPTIGTQKPSNRIIYIRLLLIKYCTSHSHQSQYSTPFYIYIHTHPPHPSPRPLIHVYMPNYIYDDLAQF